MKTLLSLFDYSGRWSDPFALSGWNVIQWDIKIADFMDINLIEDAEFALDNFEDVDGIIAAPPCTDFSVSGAQYWKIKDEDGRTWKSVEYVHQVMRLVNLFRPTDPDYDDVFFWAVENPVGRISKLVPDMGEPYYFQPYEFAGHLKLKGTDIMKLHHIRQKNGHNITQDEINHIFECEAYTKRTGLWGEFNRDLEKRPIRPVKGAPQGSPIQRSGGKSDKTKEIRSNTPMGFAWAFYEANKNHKININQ